MRVFYGDAAHARVLEGYHSWGFITCERVRERGPGSLGGWWVVMGRHVNVRVESFCGGCEGGIHMLKQRLKVKDECECGICGGWDIGTYWPYCHVSMERVRKSTLP